MVMTDVDWLALLHVVFPALFRRALNVYPS